MLLCAGYRRSSPEDQGGGGTAEEESKIDEPEAVRDLLCHGFPHHHLPWNARWGNIQHKCTYALIPHVSPAHVRLSLICSTTHTAKYSSVCGVQIFRQRTLVGMGQVPQCILPEVANFFFFVCFCLFVVFFKVFICLLLLFLWYSLCPQTLGLTGLIFSGVDGVT